MEPVGFYTVEIREGGIRKGFELVSLDGKTGLLSHVDIKSPHRVGKYRVNLIGFEDFLDSINLPAYESKLIIIDEIGKMECFSVRFRGLILRILDSEGAVIATIALKGDRFIEEIKRRDDVSIFEITRENREALLNEISSILSSGDGRW